MKTTEKPSPARTNLSVLFTVGLLLAGVLSPAAETRDIRIVAPYGGFVTNEYVRDGDQEIELTDTDAMFGLYLQWIRPDAFQGNVFVYYAPEVNYAQLLGLHTNVDGYFTVGPVDNLVFGGGLELISIDIDAGDNVEPLTEFELHNIVTVPFLRAGKRFPISTANVDITLFPWAGAELSMQNGELSFIMPPFPGGPPMPQEVESDIEEHDPFALAGLNVRTTFFRFLQVDAKYSASFDTNDLHSRVSVMTNAFVTRTWGVSWRFSYMETSVGSTLYNIFGVVAMF